MRITQEILTEGMSSNGGWSNQQMRCLGVSVPLVRGWRDDLLGAEVREADVDRFLMLKDAHVKKGNLRRGKRVHSGKTGAEILQWIEDNQFVSYDDEKDVVSAEDLVEFLGL